MTERERISHLLRRFGFGAGRYELQHYEPLGYDGTLDRLLNYENVEEGFSIDPWEIAHEEGKEEIYVDPPRFASLWALRMLMTRRPLEQKLTLFWHNHFAVSGEKVGLGPALMDYLETLRSLGASDFETLLKAVAKEPSMLLYLDGNTNYAGHPNENFAREVMELFTVGIGHYSESDVKEAARAFTGWGVRYLMFESGGDKTQEFLREAVRHHLPTVVFCESPSLHDAKPKTILGQTGRFSGDDVLSMLAKRPETAEFLGRKLFEYFAYSDPSSEVAEKIGKLFIQNEGNIKAVLKGLTEMDEFWSAACIHKRVKSPADFVVPILRQMNLRDILIAAHSKDATPSSPLPKTLRDTCGLLFGTMLKQGMFLLYPPNVKGWNWGTAWITTNTMIERVNFANLIFGVGQPDQPLAAYTGALIMQTKPSSDLDCVEAFLEIFDGEFATEKRDLLNQAFTKAGGMSSLAHGPSASRSLSALGKLVFGSPEFQFC